jgi:hypothetical protein
MNRVPVPPWKGLLEPKTAEHYRKSLWFTSAGGAVRISLIALACLFLSATGAWADTFTYTYTGNDFTTVTGAYTMSDSVMGTIVLSAPLPSNLALTDESALLVSYSFSDGVQTLTNLDSFPFEFLFETSASGAITSWAVGIVNPCLPVNCNSPEIVTTSITSPPTSFDMVNTLNVLSAGSNSGDPGAWSGPVESAVPEPGALSLMLSGLLGLGLLVGVKRYK